MNAAYNIRRRGRQKAESALHSGPEARSSSCRGRQTPEPGRLPRQTICRPCRGTLTVTWPNIADALFRGNGRTKVRIHSFAEGETPYVGWEPVDRVTNVPKFSHVCTLWISGSPENGNLSYKDHLDRPPPLHPSATLREIVPCCGRSEERLHRENPPDRRHGWSADNGLLRDPTDFRDADMFGRNLWKSIGSTSTIW